MYATRTGTQISGRNLQLYQIKYLIWMITNIYKIQVEFLHNILCIYRCNKLCCFYLCVLYLFQRCSNTCETRNESVLPPVFPVVRVKATSYFPSPAASSLPADLPSDTPPTPAMLFQFPHPSPFRQSLISSPTLTMCHPLPLLGTA